MFNQPKSTPSRINSIGKFGVERAAFGESKICLAGEERQAAIHSTANRLPTLRSEETPERHGSLPFGRRQDQSMTA
jgi:hypothetical protein